MTLELENAMKTLSDLADEMPSMECKDWKVAINTVLEALKQESNEDVMAIHTQGLDEGIRCAMCTNSMKSNRSCDGGCVVNEDMYREVMNTIRNHIAPHVTPARKVGKWIHGHCGVDDYIRCSECGREVVQNIVTLEGDLPEDAFTLCPFCGADMRGVE